MSLNLFKKSKPLITLTIQVPLDPKAAAQVANDVTILLQHASPEDIALLAKACQKPLLRSQALEELKKHV